MNPDGTDPGHSLVTNSSSYWEQHSPIEGPSGTERDIDL
eukprot:CAMPEP_0172456624 /NCGR_PEP_ID=MMETSP1065-20121228/16756_1 /TAXON_ID=265537 /ORGANISM="Amphiprora paludosa, Strain CCMP125" /LENGTH=38 /DNA_ID= /DNA_START= /DNA_END= /DNA_ORIENTATION=